MGLVKPHLLKCCHAFPKLAISSIFPYCILSARGNKSVPKLGRRRKSNSIRMGSEIKRSIIPKLNQRNEPLQSKMLMREEEKETNYEYY